MLTLAFPDLGQKGNFGALSIGMPPKVTSNDNGTRLDPDTSLHLEVSYRHQLNENVAVTPGFFVITNPNHNSNNPTQVVGVVRTTISF
jgi:carbohydrate-selective porin OprB